MNLNYNYNLDWQDKNAFENAVDIFSRLKGDRRIVYEYVTDQFFENNIQVKIEAKNSEDIFLFAMLFSDLKNTRTTIPTSKQINNEAIIINIKRRFYKLLTILLIFFTLIFTFVVVYSCFLPREMSNTILFEPKK